MPDLSREELLPFPDQMWLGFQHWQKKPPVNYEDPGISQRAFLGFQVPAQLLMPESAFGYDPGSLSPSLPFKEGYWRLKIRWRDGQMTNSFAYASAIAHGIILGPRDIAEGAKGPCPSLTFNK